MNHAQHDKTDRREISKRDLEDALKQVLIAPSENRPRSENREPTKEKLTARYRLDRRSRSA